MRKDLCYFTTADVVSVYNAYLGATTNAKFRRECNQEPYHTLSFGLNFSAKFNFNGGSCTLHFIRWQGGTAVDYRFSLAQLAGARCEKYADALNADVAALLGAAMQKTALPIELFLDARNKYDANGAVAQPAVPMQPVSAKRVCNICNAELDDTAQFCFMCGTKVEADPPIAQFCTVCGAQYPNAAAKFCIRCGAKR